MTEASTHQLADSSCPRGCSVLLLKWALSAGINSMQRSDPHICAKTLSPNPGLLVLSVAGAASLSTQSGRPVTWPEALTPGWFSAVRSWGVLSPHLPHSLQLPTPPSPVLSSANSSTRSMFLRELKTLWEFMVECKISKPPGSYLPPPAILRFWVLVGINVAVMSVYLCPCRF